MQARLLQSDTARKVLNAPKESFKTAKQTLENCQDNLQTLGNLLHKSVAQAQSVHIQTRMVAPEAEQVHCCASCALQGYQPHWSAPRVEHRCPCLQ